LVASVLATLAVLAFTGEEPEAPPAPLIGPAAQARLAQVARLDGATVTANVMPPARPVSAPLAKSPIEVRQWPDTVPRQTLSAAVRDPFAVNTPSPPPAPMAVSSTPAPAPAEAPPAVPPMSYRYLGQVTDPDGKRLILLAKGAKEAAVSTGALLEDGFRVQGIQAKAISIVHTATNTAFEISIPDTHDPTSP